MADKKPKLGSGERFKELEGELEKEGKKDPKALAAFIGRRKYGKKTFEKLAEKGESVKKLVDEIVEDATVIKVEPSEKPVSLDTPDEITLTDDELLAYLDVRIREGARIYTRPNEVVYLTSDNSDLIQKVAQRIYDSVVMGTVNAVQFGNDQSLLKATRLVNFNPDYIAKVIRKSLYNGSLNLDESSVVGDILTEGKVDAERVRGLVDVVVEDLLIEGGPGSGRYPKGSGGNTERKAEYPPVEDFTTENLGQKIKEFPGGQSLEVPHERPMTKAYYYYKRGYNWWTKYHAGAMLNDLNDETMEKELQGKTDIKLHKSGKY